MLWTIWVTQGLYDARFATRDGTTWFYGFLQLLTYGYMSSVAGSFDVAYKFFDRPADPYASAPQLIQRVGDGEVSSADILRALCAASGIFAVSRFILLVQYSQTFRFARQAGRKQIPLVVTMAGIATNMACWLIALIVSFRDTRASSIARLCLWVTGILIEWTATCDCVVLAGRRTYMETNDEDVTFSDSERVRTLRRRRHNTDLARSVR